MLLNHLQIIVVGMFVAKMGITSQAPRMGQQEGTDNTPGQAIAFSTAPPAPAAAPTWKQASPDAPPRSTPYSDGNKFADSKGIDDRSNRERSQSPRPFGDLRNRASQIFGRGPVLDSSNLVVLPDTSQEKLLQAWIEYPDGTKVEYSLDFMLANHDPQIWGADANVYVYPFSQESGRSPVFKVPSRIFECSPQLSQLIHAQAYSTDYQSQVRTTYTVPSDMAVEESFQNLSVGYRHSSPDAARYVDGSDVSSQSLRSIEDAAQDIHLFFPLKLSDGAATSPNEFDIQSLVALRNLLAFLTAQPLVTTPNTPSRFKIFVSISKLLMEYGFNNQDGSSYGESVTDHFNYYLNDSMLYGVRESLDDIVQGLILGERMRSERLYTEAFAHAVGRYDEVKDIHKRLSILVSQTTWTKLGRANMLLKRNQKNVEDRLKMFSFPSIFTGIAASTSMTEYKSVRFETWKASYESLRKECISHYKIVFGSWPPKAGKNSPFTVDGILNRLVLNHLYSDMCSLYDLIVDKSALTPRALAASDVQDAADSDVTTRALRILLGEYDRSSPPVLPAIPYDLPLLPAVNTVEPGYSRWSEEYRVKCDWRALEPHETILTLQKAYNQNALRTHFTNMFTNFEKKEGKNKSAQDLADQRIGYWIFLYAVIQTLPIVVMDAPGVQSSSGVEYPLCTPVFGSMPWNEKEVNRVMFAINNSNNIVEMPADVVNNGVEGTYRRSHCWNLPELLRPVHDEDTSTLYGEDGEPMSPLAQPPKGLFGSPLTKSPSLGTPAAAPVFTIPRAVQTMTDLDGDSRRPSRQERELERDKRRSIALGITPIPMPLNGPAPYSSRPNSRPVSRGSPLDNPLTISRPASLGSPLDNTLVNSRSTSEEDNRISDFEQRNFSGYSLGAAESAYMSTAESGKGHSEEEPESPSSAGPTTFDEILKGIESEKAVPQKSKKRSRLFKSRAE